MGTELDGVWAIIFNEGKNYIGKIVETVQPNTDGGVYYGTVAGGPDEGRINKSRIFTATWVTLEPVFDFFSPLRPVQGTGPDGKPQMGFSRDPIVTPFDFFAHEGKIHVRVGGIAFFDEMHDDDRRTYTSFVEQAQKTQMAARAARSGLSLVGPGGNDLKNPPNIRR